MTPEQFAQLISLLGKLLDRPYSISGASDWAILVVVGGAFGTVLLAMIAMMWRSLWVVITEHKTDNLKAHDSLWTAMRDCKEDCCPALQRKKP